MIFSVNASTLPGRAVRKDTSRLIRDRLPAKAATAFAAVVTAALMSASAWARESIMTGLIEPLSGRIAAIGNDVLSQFKYVTGEIHKRGGVLGRRKLEIVALPGRNGVGRTTTIKAVIREVQPHGSIEFKGQEIAGLKSHEIARPGIGQVPENRDIFPTLTTRENLLLGVKNPKAHGRWSIEEMFELFYRTCGRGRYRRRVSLGRRPRLSRPRLPRLRCP